METLGVLSFLSLCTYDDLKSKKVRVVEICIFAGLGLVNSLKFSPKSYLSMAGGLFIGTLLYIFACFSKEKIGKGDALMVMTLGLFLGFFQTLKLVWFACLLATIGGLVTIIYKGEDKEYEMPFSPFLLVAYIIVFITELLAGVVA